MMWLIWPMAMFHMKPSKTKCSRSGRQRRPLWTLGQGVTPCLVKYGLTARRRRARRLRGRRGLRDAPRRHRVRGRARGSSGRPILRRVRFRRGRVQRVVRDYRSRRWRRGVIAVNILEHRRGRALCSYIVKRTRDQPFERVPDGIKQVADYRERLRILVVIFLGILLIVVIVLRARNRGQAKHKRSA
jgi:hypothetical protein